MTARLASGERVTGSLLIGADGLWSNIRKSVIGDGPPRVSGHTTYRSVIPTDEMPEDLRWNAATLWAGPKCHIVHYPLSGWKVFNLVVTYHNDAPEPVAGKPVSDDEVMQGFAHVHARAQAIIRHGKNWRLWVLCDRDPNECWVDGRVALLGDAAHPMMQYFAQGACMALEDAVCLSHMLGAHPDDPATALERYRAQRFPRTARVQLQSRAIGEHIYHPSGEHARIRNAIMSAKTSEDYYDDLAWLYGGTGLAGVGQMPRRPGLELIQHPLAVGAVERKRRHVDLEPFAALAHHLVAAGHEARRGRQRHAAGVFEALARREHRLLADHAFAADFLLAARGVGDDPVPRPQLHRLLAGIGDDDGVGPEKFTIVPPTSVPAGNSARR